MMDSRKKKRYAAYAAAVILSIISFTPLVIPSGVSTPWLLGMPRTLWAGILLTAAFVVVAYLAGRYAPRDGDESREEPSSNPHRAS